MQDLLPSKISWSWKNVFFDAFLCTHIQQSNQDLQTLQILFERRYASPLISHIQSVGFWQSLSGAENKEQVEVLKQYWEKIQFDAHLNTKQLLNLYRDKVLPLIEKYQDILALVQAKAPDHHWVNVLQLNLSKLQRLKHYLQQALLNRCEAHKILQQPRHFDDVLAAFCMRINSLFPHKLAQPEPSTTLNDDRRLLIFDLLVNQIFPEEQLHEQILAPVPKRGQKALLPSVVIQRKLDEAHFFCYQTWVAMEYKTLNPVWFSGEQIKQKCVEIARWLKINHLWAYRHAFYLLLSFSAYYFILQFVKPVLLTLISEVGVSFFSSVLFFTVALAPLRSLLNSGVQKILTQIKEWLTLRKRMQVLTTVQLFNLNAHMLANYLSHPIIDLARFDIPHLQRKVQGSLENIKRAQKQLELYYWGEKIFCEGLVTQKIQELQINLHTQQQEIMISLKTLCQHMVERVGEDILLLSDTPVQNRLPPLLTKEQVLRYRAFVQQYSDEQGVKAFDEQVNVAKKWLVQLDSLYFTPVPQNSAITWGQSILRHDALQGWQTILENATTAPALTQSSLALHQLLTGKIPLATQQFAQLMVQLEPIIPKVQNFIFATLSQRHAQHAALLAPEQKAIIQDWYLSHQPEIDKANKMIATLLQPSKELQHNAVSDQELAGAYALFQAVDCYYHAFGKTDALLARQSQLKQYFENYQGESSMLYRLIHLFPDQERGAMLDEIAKKRADWIITHLNQGVSAARPFDQHDLALFHDFHFYQMPCTFKFSAQIVGHGLNRGSQNPVETTFLKSCQMNGLYP